MSNEPLLTAIADGDEQAMQRFFTQYASDVYRFAMGRCGDSQLASDILNAVMLDVWRQAVRFQGRSKVTTWLMGIARHKLIDHYVGVVAAAGNGGPDAAPSYPAAQAGVLAVTAVDSEQRIAPDANRGGYIKRAAPGVDVWVAAEKSGARYASGSSMATPLVVAALAQLGGNLAVAVELFKTARDLGAPGKDPLMGWGLLQFPACAGR